MNDQDFQSQVMRSFDSLHTAISKLEVGQAQTAVRLDSLAEYVSKQNGAVARHEEAIGKINQHVASRQEFCPMVNRLEVQIKPIHDALVRQRGINRLVSDIHKRLKLIEAKDLLARGGFKAMALISAVVSGVIILIAHFVSILPLFAKKP